MAVVALEAEEPREDGNMEKIAKEFQNSHKKGTVSNVTPYSFKYSETTKNGNTVDIVYMKSYFMDFD